MSLNNCCTCNHEFTKEDGDFPHADGGFMGVNHGGGQCVECYLKHGHWRCKCGALAFDSMKFCSQCGVAKPCQ